MGCILYQTRSFSFGHHADVRFESSSFLLHGLFFLFFFYIYIHMIIFKLFVEVVGCFVF